MHDMLISYVNSTLDAEGRASFERHLAGCADCRSELPVLEKLRSEVEVLGEGAFAGHPEPAELVGTLLPEASDEPAPGRREEVRRHLEICALCAEESRWVRGEAMATGTATGTAAGRTRAAGGGPTHGTATPAASPAGFRIPAWGWGVAAALLVLAVGLPLSGRLSPPAPATGVGRVVLLEPTQRAEPAATVSVPAGAAAVHLLLRADIAPGDFPVTVEILDASGRTLHRQAGVVAADLHRERFLLLTCSRTDCPDGSYVGRITPGRGDAIPVEYPFTLSTLRD